VTPGVVPLLQELLRFDTTNPPGNEEACVAHLESLLRSHGIDSERYERTPGRPNLVARHAGTRAQPPLLLYGHVDVVTTSGQRWTHPPFAGELLDGVVWGRGALDMKGGVAMLVRAFVDAAERNSATPLVLLVVSDEEDGGDDGMRFLTREHPELFAGIRHALGEVGGAKSWIGGRPFYGIQVAEKMLCWLRATIRGTGGHAATGADATAMARLGAVLQTLEHRQPPVRIVPVVREWFERMAAALPGDAARAAERLLDPATADAAARALGPRARPLTRVIRNTAEPTIVRGGEKINVIPSEIELQIDCRLLPGASPDDVIAELHELLGEDLELEVVRHDAVDAEPDLDGFELLADVLRELDPEAAPVPTLLPGVTDGRFLAPLGIQSYGFLPLRLPEEFPYVGLIHNADERVPAAALEFGVEALGLAIERYRG
jgi:acetylornithine deacetylase/succinyl-diaminopimelate desuccinylase-like protein